MTTAGRKIIDGLRDAARGNFARVHIDGQTWVRHDAESPEGMLMQARGKIAELTERIAELEAALRDIAHYWREYGDNEGDIEKYIKRGEAALKGKS